MVCTSNAKSIGCAVGSGVNPALCKHRRKRYVRSATTFTMVSMFESFTSVNAGATVEYTCGNYIDSPSYACNVGSEEETQALEVQEISTSVVYASSQDNPMTYEEFQTYPSQVGKWKLNTPRNLQFESNCFFKSPTSPIDCTDDCIDIETIKALNDTTWAALALNVCAGYFPSGDTEVELGAPPAGQIFVSPISKCQNMTFAAGPQYILTDQYDNTYIMHASGANTTEGVADAVSEAELPEGWSIEQVTLGDDLTIYPDMTDDGSCYYTVVRDSADNSYHMIGCSPDRARPTDIFAACPSEIKSTSAASPSPSPTSPSPTPSPPSGSAVERLQMASLSLALILTISITELM